MIDDEPELVRMRLRHDPQWYRSHPWQEGLEGTGEPSKPDLFISLFHHKPEVAWILHLLECCAIDNGGSTGVSSDCSWPEAKL